MFVLELLVFHGPTFTFKDVALQLLGNLFEFFLLREKVLRFTPTATNSIFILHPEGRVLPIQEAQMTNVHNIAVKLKLSKVHLTIVRYVIIRSNSFFLPDSQKINDVRVHLWLGIHARTSYIGDDSGVLAGHTIRTRSRTGIAAL
jgi:hypothetical protein